MSSRGKEQETQGDEWKTERRGVRQVGAKKLKSGIVGIGIGPFELFDFLIVGD